MARKTKHRQRTVQLTEEEKSLNNLADRVNDAIEKILDDYRDSEAEVIIPLSVEDYLEEMRANLEELFYHHAQGSNVLVSKETGELLTKEKFVEDGLNRFKQDCIDITFRESFDENFREPVKKEVLKSIIKKRKPHIENIY